MRLGIMASRVERRGGRFFYIDVGGDCPGGWAEDGRVWYNTFTNGGQPPVAAETAREGEA